MRTFSAVATTDSISTILFPFRPLPSPSLLLLSKKAKVLPQLDFSATIKAKRRAVDGENDAESTQALFGCSITQL